MDKLNRRRHFMLASSAASILIVFTVIILEIALHLAADAFPQVAVILNPSVFDGTYVEPGLLDPELISRGNPRYPEHDANGFRNRAIPDSADIVTIGDSQTYGSGVAFDQAWPRVLEKLSSCRIYNMAFGGYGPLQYSVLAREAVRFKPRLIFVAIYFGNDFYNNWEMYLRSPKKYPVPENLLEPALELERSMPLSRDVEDFFRMGQADPTESSTESPTEGSRSLRHFLGSMRHFLSRNSTLWGFGRAIKNRFFATPETVLSNEFEIAIRALKPKQLDYASVFRGTDWRTILTSRYREAVQNSDDPRIRVGYWLTEWAIQDINKFAKQIGIASTFVLLPTKESVFAPKIPDAKGHRFFEKLIAEENLHRQRLIQYMQKANINYIDMARALRSNAQQPYFANADGHPNAIGNKVIAANLVEHTGVCK